MMGSSGTVIVPRRLDISGLRSIISDWPHDADQVSLNFSRHEFVLPVGSVALSCLLSGTRNKPAPRVSVDPGSCGSLGYWARMGFFRNIGMGEYMKTGQYHDPSGRFSEIKLVDDDENIDTIAQEVVDVLGPPDDWCQIYMHIVTEALNNICQHSSSIGYCASQYYSSNNTVCFAFADTGIGLQEALSGHQPRDDEHAIAIALKPGISGRTEFERRMDPLAKRNRGVGLSMIRYLVENNAGSMCIWSGECIYFGDGGGQRFEATPVWPGTLVSIEMPRTAIKMGIKEARGAIMPMLKGAEQARDRALHRPLP